QDGADAGQSRLVLRQAEGGRFSYVLVGVVDRAPDRFECTMEGELRDVRVDVEARGLEGLAQREVDPLGRQWLDDAREVALLHREQPARTVAAAGAQAGR